MQRGARANPSGLLERILKISTFMAVKSLQGFKAHLQTAKLHCLHFHGRGFGSRRRAGSKQTKQQFHLRSDTGISDARNEYRIRTNAERRSTPPLAQVVCIPYTAVVSTNAAQTHTVGGIEVNIVLEWRSPCLETCKNQLGEAPCRPPSPDTMDRNIEILLLSSHNLAAILLPWSQWQGSFHFFLGGG